MLSPVVLCCLVLCRVVNRVVFKTRSKSITDGKKLVQLPARDVPGTSPEGPLKVVTSGTSR